MARIPSVATLGDFSTIFTGVIASRLASAEGAPDYPVINAKDISQKLPPPENLDRLAVSQRSVLNRFGLRPGDVVLTARGVTIRAGVARNEHDGVLAGANLIVVRPNRQLQSQVLATWLQHPRVQDTLLEARTGAGTPGFTVTQLAGLKIALPPLDWQDELGEIVDLADRHYEAALRAALLRRTLSADLVFDAFNPNLGGSER